MMDNRLVHNVIQILPFLLKGRASINTIVRQTGIYKNSVFEANNFLKKAELAIRTRDTEVHQQKIFVELTEFGQELARSIMNTERFEKSFDQLIIK
jgi:inner membrane protein involved in colicin E2 resistance